jgi:glycosyltransferase involved in cell wall biosynthesis
MRLLWLQSSSVFEGFGGIEYYLDDLITSTCEIWGPDSQQAIVPRRTKAWQNLPRPYSVTDVAFSRNRLVSKIQNRFCIPYLMTAIRKAREMQPDYLVCGHVSLGPLTALVSYWTGIPYLSCVYGIEAWGGLMAADEWALRQSAGIISISDWTKQRLTQRGIDPGLIQIIHPRLDTRLENRTLAERPSSAGRLHLLTVSRLDASEQYKGQDHVIHALALLRNRAPELSFHYTIQGEGNDRPRLERLVETWGLQESVTFAGRVPNRAELDARYAAADVFVMPSRFGKWERRWRGEGFGIVYLEAAAFGVPSVAYDTGGVTDIITNREDGILVRPDDIAALAEALAGLARDPHRRAALGRNAHSMVQRRFTRPAIRHEIAAAFDAVNKRNLEIEKASRSRQPSAHPVQPL